MRRFSFKAITFYFFFLLISFNLFRWFGCPGETAIIAPFCQYPWYFYGPLLGFYLVIPVILSFFPCSRFHTRNILCKGKTDKPVVSITFDDGPDPELTPVVLKILKDNGIKATFFLVGEKVAGNESLVERIHNEGHGIGNHTYSHSGLWAFFPAAKMHAEIRKTDDLLEKILHRRMNYFRPPYGVVNPMVESAVNRGRHRMIAWSNRSFDTLTGNEEYLVKRVARKLKPGDIILLHDTRKVTANALQRLIHSIRDRGFAVVSLENLVNIPCYE